MATDPFTGAFVNRLENRTHAYRFTCETGDVVHFRYFCCADPYQFTVTKAPVVVADISPDIQCAGVVNGVTVNLDSSYVPLGTIATWRIAWGDGTADDVPPPAWPPGNVTHTYAAAGTFDIRITITDTLGHSSSTTYQVLIVDCALGSILADYMYALSLTTGPWLRDMTVAVPAWVQHINGLTGNWLNGRDLKVDPHRRHLPVAIRHVWIATQAGVAKSTDNMDNWTQLYNRLNDPRNTAGDGAPPTKANLDFVGITFNPLVKDEVYILAYDTVVAPTRSFVYFTHDGGITFDNWEIDY